MSEEKIKLFHGTSADIVGGKVLTGKEPLIGKRMIKESGLSGTLTDDRDFAVKWSHKRGGDPIVLTYMIPNSVIIDEGIIDFKFSSHGFVTNLEIAFEKLPKVYVSALISLNMLSIDILKMMIEKRELSFHQVPFKYLVDVEDS